MKLNHHDFKNIVKLITTFLFDLISEVLSKFQPEWKHLGFLEHKRGKS